MRHADIKRVAKTFLRKTSPKMFGVWWRKLEDSQTQQKAHTLLGRDSASPENKIKKINFPLQKRNKKNSTVFALFVEGAPSTYRRLCGSGYNSKSPPRGNRHLTTWEEFTGKCTKHHWLDKILWNFPRTSGQLPNFLWWKIPRGDLKRISKRNRIRTNWNPTKWWW